MVSSRLLRKKGGISFNVSSSTFAKIDNIDKLVENHNYLLRIRKFGQTRDDIIAKFIDSKPDRVCFDKLWSRNSRTMDTEKYKPWISANGEYDILKTDVNRGITIFDLGQNGNSITSTKSPDDVSEYLRNAINDVELKFPDQYAKGWLSSFFLGGKRKTSKRKRNKKHNKTKKNM